MKLWVKALRYSETQWWSAQSECLIVVFASGTHLDLMDGGGSVHKKESSNFKVFLSRSLSSVMITACAVRRSWGELLSTQVNSKTSESSSTAKLFERRKPSIWNCVVCVTLLVVCCRSSSKGEWSHAGGPESVCVTGYCTCSVGLWLVRLDSHTDRSAALTLHITCFYIYVIFVLDTVWCH